MIKLGRFSLVMTCSALVPRTRLSVMRLSCCRDRGQPAGTHTAAERQNRAPGRLHLNTGHPFTLHFATHDPLAASCLAVYTPE